MESNAFRAMTIGAGVLIAIATISLVLIYYNTAKESFTTLGKGTNFNSNYNKHILDILTKSDAVGTDVINLLNYFGENPGIDIKFFKQGYEQPIANIDKNDIKPNQKFRINSSTDYTDIEIIFVD